MPRTQLCARNRLDDFILQFTEQAKVDAQHEGIPWHKVERRISVWQSLEDVVAVGWRRK